MKRFLIAAILAVSACFGVATTGTPAAAEHSESPAGPERGVASRLANGHSNACIILDNEQVRCWGSSAGTGVPESGNIGDDETPDSVRTVDVGPGRTVKAVENGESAEGTMAFEIPRGEETMKMQMLFSLIRKGGAWLCTGFRPKGR